MDSRYKYWCFNASRGTLPNFVLNSDKKFCTKILDYDEHDDRSNLDKIGISINRFADRISSLKIDVVLGAIREKKLLDRLRSMKPVGFSNLTTLDVEFFKFDNISLLQLSPQLENLRLHCIDTVFDLSTVRNNDKCFTKLKSLDIYSCKLDVSKILSKCCKTLKHLMLGQGECRHMKKLKHNFSNLKSLEVNASFSEKPVKDLLSTSAGSLKSLKLELFEDDKVVIDFSTLLDQSTNITTLNLCPVRNNIDNFLKKCPDVKNLILTYCYGEIKDFVMKNLTRVEFVRCNAFCISSVLKQLSKSCVRTLDFNCKEEEIGEIDLTSLNELKSCEFSAIEKLDTVYFSCINDPEIINKVHQLFPPEAKVSI